MGAVRAYLAGSATALAAMAGRLGWTDWPDILQPARTAVIVLAGVLVVLAVMAVIAGPGILLILVLERFCILISTKPDGGGQQHGADRGCPHPAQS